MTQTLMKIKIIELNLHSRIIHFSTIKMEKIKRSSRRNSSWVLTINLIMAVTEQISLWCLISHLMLKLRSRLTCLHLTNVMVTINHLLTIEPRTLSLKTKLMDGLHSQMIVINYLASEDNYSVIRQMDKYYNLNRSKLWCKDKKALELQIETVECLVYLISLRHKS
jgi:hypothetical protein